MRLSLLLLFVAGLAFSQSQAPTKPPDSNRDSQLFKKPPKDRDGKLRILMGVVLLPDNTHVQGAVVRISNQRTGEVRAFITQADGQYRFDMLEREVIFTLYAEHKGAKSRTRTLTPFDPRIDPVINLVIEPKTDDKKEDKKTEEKK
jgi:hypothetical protein